MTGCCLVNFLQVTLSPVTTNKRMSAILHYGALAVRILWSLVLAYFMINLVTIFFTRMLPHLMYGEEEMESKAGSQSGVKCAIAI